MKKPLKILLTLFFTVIILFGFTETANMVTGYWYQQFLPNLNGRQIVDITFTDSLTGYAVTTRLSNTDTSFILKTTDSGNNWGINHADSGFIFKRIQFINQNTGFAGGTHFMKTTNAGSSWIIMSSFLFLNCLTFKPPRSITRCVIRSTRSGI